MNLKIIIIVILTIITIPYQASLFAENKKMRIAIMDFSPKGITIKDARTISELIRNDMINTGEYIVVERDQMNRILYEQGFQMTGCTDDSCAVQAGKLLSANKILVGSLIKLDEKIIITGRIVDVEKGTADFSEKAATESRSDLDATAERFVKRLTDRMLGKKPEPEKKAKYKTVIYSTGYNDTETFQRCGYSSLAFAIAACVTAIPAAVYQSKYSSAKWEYNNTKNIFNMTLAFSGTGTFQLYGLTQALAMRAKVSDMKKYIRSRDASLYVLAGFGGLSVIMAVATLATYVNSEYALLQRMDSAPFAVYPVYYCEPAQDNSTAYNHHINIMTYYRF